MVHVLVLACAMTAGEQYTASTVVNPAATSTATQDSTVGRLTTVGDRPCQCIFDTPELTLRCLSPYGRFGEDGLETATDLADVTDVTSVSDSPSSPCRCSGSTCDTHKPRTVF